MSMLSNSGTNSAAVMYPVKPIFDHNIKIDIPDVMYKVASFHGGNLPKQVSNSNFFISSYNSHANKGMIVVSINA